MYNRDKVLRVRQQVKEQLPKVQLQGQPKPFDKEGKGNGFKQKGSAK